MTPRRGITSTPHGLTAALRVEPHRESLTLLAGACDRSPRIVTFRFRGMRKNDYGATTRPGAPFIPAWV